MNRPDKFRPWGQLGWVIDRGPDLSWHLVGALNTEDRSLAVWRALQDRMILSATNLIQIENPPSASKSKADNMIKERRELFILQGGNEDDISKFRLDEEYGKTLEFAEYCLESCDGNLLLDISSLPKMFFYPILRVLLESSEIENLLVTYTVPEAYTNEKLALNYHDWAHLPTFSGDYSRDRSEMLIVNVGFEPMGLPNEISEDDSRHIKLLFPFPAPPESVRRSWEFVQTLQRGRSLDTFNLYRTDAKDISDAFDRLNSLTSRGNQRATFAPFGPKPISVAMCIHATLTGFEVFYTQPRVYHPEYSTGVAATYAYWIRMNGMSLYEL